MLDNKTLDYLTSGGGNRLIIGPPGSGKTYTLLRIVGHLIEKKDVDPFKIIIFTFNRKWSKILREETVRLLNKSIWEIPIGTFFSFCNDFLAWKDLRSINKGKIKKQKGKHASDPPYNEDSDNIINSATQWNILREVISKVERRDYPYSHRYFNSTRYVANSFLQEVFDFILRSQENLLRPEDLLQRFTPHNNPVLAELSGLYSRYIDELHRQGKSNYGMLLQETAATLREDTLIRKEWKEKYEYIIVDELQETNKAQLEIIKNISNENCIFFGNDDQAVYNFRGGISDNFLQVYRRLMASGRVFFLSVNHRSAKNIVGVTDRFIKSDPERISKKNIGRSSAGEVQVRDFDSMLDETEYIAGMIRSLKENGKIKPENIAIIIKGLGYETHLIENALRQSGIAFIRRSSRSMLDNHYVLYIINYLRLIIALDEINKEDNIFIDDGETDNDNNCYHLESLLENHLLSEITGLDPLFYMRLRSGYLKHGSSGEAGIGHNNNSFWDHICEEMEKNLADIPDEEIADREKLHRVLSSLKKSLSVANSNVYEFLMDFLEDPVSGLFHLLEEKDTISYPGYFHSSWVGIGDFLESVKEYSRVEPKTNIRSYMHYLENLIDNNFLEEIEESTREQSLRGMVNILSFHQCKGLEYDAVFIPFINNNYLPSRFKQPQIFDLQTFRSIDDGTEVLSRDMQKEHMRGEVRLFYSGITRARKKLYITSNRSRGVSTFFKRIKEIVAELDNMIKDQGDLIGKVKKGTKRKEIYYETDKKWLLKKRAMVSLERSRSGLYVNYQHLIRRAIELKYFYPKDDWWKLVKPTSNTKIPYQNLPPIFNYSSLNTYRDCPFKYKVRYFYRISEDENLNLKIGKIYHSILKEFFETSIKDRNWEEFIKIIEKNFEIARFDFLFIKKELLSTALGDFKRYFDNFMPPSKTNIIMEKEFDFILGGNKIRGRIDQINQLPGGNIELIDFKSGSSGYSKSDLEEEIQLRLYSLALNSDKKLERLKQGGVIMKYLILGDDRKTEYILPEDHYNEKEIKSIVNRLIVEIKKEIFIPSPENYMSCRYCDYKILCPRFYGQEK